MGAVTDVDTGTVAGTVVDTRIRIRTLILIRTRIRMSRIMEEIIVRQPHRFIVPNWV